MDATKEMCNILLLRALKQYLFELLFQLEEMYNFPSQELHFTIIAKRSRPVVFCSNPADRHQTYRQQSLKHNLPGGGSDVFGDFASAFCKRGSETEVRNTMVLHTSWTSVVNDGEPRFNSFMFFNI